MCCRQSILPIREPPVLCLEDYYVFVEHFLTIQWPNIRLVGATRIA